MPVRKPVEHHIHSFTNDERRVLAIMSKVEFEELDRTLAEVSAKEICGLTDRKYRIAVKAIWRQFQRFENWEAYVKEQQRLEAKVRRNLNK